MLRALKDLKVLKLVYCSFFKIIIINVFVPAVCRASDATVPSTDDEN